MARCAAMVASLLVFLPLIAQEPSAPRPDLEPLSRMVRDIVLKQAPKSVEDVSGWGKTAPIPKLRNCACQVCREPSSRSAITMSWRTGCGASSKSRCRTLKRTYPSRSPS